MARGWLFGWCGRVCMWPSVPVQTSYVCIHMMSLWEPWSNQQRSRAVHLFRLVFAELRPSLSHRTPLSSEQCSINKNVAMIGARAGERERDRHRNTEAPNRKLNRTRWTDFGWDPVQMWTRQRSPFRHICSLLTTHLQRYYSEDPTGLDWYCQSCGRFANEGK